MLPNCDVRNNIRIKVRVFHLLKQNFPRCLEGIIQEEDRFFDALEPSPWDRIGEEWVKNRATVQVADLGLKVTLTQAAHSSIGSIEVKWDKSATAQKVFLRSDVLDDLRLLRREERTWDIARGDGYYEWLKGRADRIISEWNRNGSLGGQFTFFRPTQYPMGSPNGFSLPDVIRGEISWSLLSLFSDEKQRKHSCCRPPVGMALVVRWTGMGCDIF